MSSTNLGARDGPCDNFTTTSFVIPCLSFELILFYKHEKQTLAYIERKIDTTEITSNAIKNIVRTMRHALKQSFE
jgi:hypothetical protein